MEEKRYIAIDLKSFFASVECVERDLDPLNTNLVVADAGRTEKTICLAVSPSLKVYGIPGRARLFEVVQKVKEANRRRRMSAPGGRFAGESHFADELKAHPELAIDYIVAPPQMARYIKHSTAIYNIYLKYVAPEDIHVYSIDEVFIDVTGYLPTYGMTAHELAMTMIRDVLGSTGITATAGIGSNMYLCKIAMDIVAKHVAPDADGVRIAELTERSYRQQLWGHKPITDFWRVGRGYARKLAENGMYTMGDVARCSVGKPEDFHNEDLLYELFGVNAELLIDHAWGYEPCTIADVKAYKPENNSFCSGQVLQSPYSFDKARLVIHEMADGAALDLVDKKLVTDQIVLDIGYDIESLSSPEIRRKYKGPVTTDRYGRQVPKPAHGSINLKRQTASARMIIEATLTLYDRIVNPELLVRRMSVTTNHVVSEEEIREEESYEQLDLFTNYQEKDQQREQEKEELQKERKVQEALLSIKKKYGKNAVLKGMSFLDGATARERNGQIGGHRAGTADGEAAQKEQGKEKSENHEGFV